MSLPAALLPWLPETFTDADGTPLAGGFLYSYAAGTSTPQDTYGQSDLDPSSVNTNPIELDASGRCPDPVFLLPTGYKFVLCDSSQDPLLPPTSPLWSFDNVQDPAYTAFGTFGALQATGTKSVSDGYTVTNDDNLSTATGSNPGNVNLQAAADRTGLPFVFMNFASAAWTVTPNGAETLNGVSGALTFAAFSTPAVKWGMFLPITGGYLVLCNF